MKLKNVYISMCFVFFSFPSSDTSLLHYNLSNKVPGPLWRHLWLNQLVSRVLLQNTTGRNTSLYTVNKQTYIHWLYINTKTYQQINFLHYKCNCISTKQLHVYTTTKSLRGILIKIKFFLISRDFIMSMDTFLTSILFSVFISSINFRIFNIFQ